MAIVAEQYQFVIGVDTHAGSHTFSVIDTVTAAELDHAEFRSPRHAWREHSGWTPHRRSTNAYCG